MNSAALNKRIHEMELAGAERVPPSFGWGWRDVDWDADSVILAVAPIDPPSWHHLTAEAMLGIGWELGGHVAFCQNNKWGYAEFKVDGDDWRQLRRLCEEFVEDPTRERHGRLLDFMRGLAPAGLAEQPI